MTGDRKVLGTDQRKQAPPRLSALGLPTVPPKPGGYASADRARRIGSFQAQPTGTAPLAPLSKPSVVQCLVSQSPGLTPARAWRPKPGLRRVSSRMQRPVQVETISAYPP